jgi:small conductance mechanosensitive channel
LNAEALRYWVPFDVWLKLKAARAQVKATREGTPSFQEHQRAFQKALAQRAQWSVSRSAPLKNPSIEQLRAQLKELEELKRALSNRRAQGLLDQVAELELYLSQLIEQERASLTPLEVIKEGEELSVEGPIGPYLASPIEPQGEPVATPSKRDSSEQSRSQQDSPDQKNSDQKNSEHENSEQKRAHSISQERLTLIKRYRELVGLSIAELEAWRAQLKELTLTLKREASAYDEELKALNQLSDHLSDELSHLLARAEIQGALSDLSLETLIGLKATRSAEEREAHARLEERVTLIERLSTRYEQAYRARLKALSPPQLPPPPPEEPEDTFQSAAQLTYATSTSEAVLSFHQSRAEALAEAIEANKDYEEELNKALNTLEEARKVTLSLDVIDARARLLSQPRFWSATRLAAESVERPTEARLKSLQQQRKLWRESLERLQQEGERWRATLSEDQSSSERLRSELEGPAGLRARLKQEQVWVTFLKEIDSYDTPKLLSAYQRDVKTLNTLEHRLQTAEERHATLSQEITELSAQRARLGDPLLRQYPAPSEEFLAWAQPLLTLARASENSEGAERSDGSSASPSLDQERAKRKAEGTTPSPLPTEVSELTESLRAKIPPRVTYYLERAQLTAQLTQALEERGSLIGERAELLAKRADIARHVWRSAALLRRRAQRGEAPTTLLTDELQRHRSLSWVSELKSEGVRALEERHEQERAWLLTEPDYGPIKTTLSEWSLLLGQILDLIEQREELASEVKRANDPQARDQLSKLERDQEAHALRVRMSQDQRWYEGVWELIHSRDTKSLDELLEGLYVELIKVERQQQLIDQQLKLTHLLSSHVERQRPLLERFEVAMSAAVERLTLRLKAERLSVLSRLDPQGTLSDVSAFNASSDLKLPSERLESLEGEARALAVMDLKRTWSLLYAYNTTLTRIRDALGPQGMLERSVGQVKDGAARLQAEHEQLARPLHRLLGARARGVVRGVSSSAVGEIDRIRDERFKTKLKAAAGILLSFCLIPLIALLITRFIAHFGEQVFSYVLREQTGRAQTERERQEREERSATLFQVFRAASNLLVWTLTGIYLLKAVQVDVTPIIASAGVLGLALAFGAQELVRDFFAGFFILLENQYNIGDIVRIQGTFGRIERITLRLTILRDEEGVVHFIPNGQVGMVSNCTREWSQARVEIGASYNAPPQQVIECLREIGDQLCADPVHGGYLLLCEVLGLERFDDSAVIYKVRLRVTAGQQWQIARLYRQRVMETFAERGIEIPFPQVVMHYTPPELSGLSEGLSAKT